MIPTLWRLKQEDCEAETSLRDLEVPNQLELQSKTMSQKIIIIIIKRISRFKDWEILFQYVRWQ